MLQPRHPARVMLLVFFKRFDLFLERGEGREKEGEWNINVCLPLAHPLLGTWPATQARALTGNHTGLVMLWFMGWCSIHWATPHRAFTLYYILKLILVHKASARSCHSVTSIYIQLNKKRIWLYQSAQAAITKYHRLVGLKLNNKSLFSHSFGGYKSKIKVSAELVSPEASLLGLWVVAFSLCPPHTVFSLCSFSMSKTSLT